MQMKLFLQEVASGHGFKPKGDAVNDLAAFQPLVETALQAEALGYVESVVTHKESYTGHRFYSALIVRGLTDSGREAAANL
jgi:hypothetical protein